MYGSGNVDPYGWMVRICYCGIPEDYWMNITLTEWHCLHPRCEAIFYTNENRVADACPYCKWDNVNWRALIYVRVEKEERYE